ncbi:MAG: tRNA (adenosine(37)-N6)-dimethylallyltransferase MiaA [Anaerolineae bacterium]|nr:tRNA (adenosine(37)-N6)-dimethylallyltransferase MiaA [Anaerolineae bacterium]
MRFTNIDKPLVIIVGSTAVGKTEMSIALAKRIKGEIVSADSRLLYRGMDIGTAKPTLEERAMVAHHLIDVADPDEVWSLALYQRAAYQAIEDVLARGKMPILVGGTGQYIRAITEGWYLPPQKPDMGLRSVLERWADEIGKQELHRRLSLLDAEAAAIIDARNVRRTIRALEVILLTGRRFSAQRGRTVCPFTYRMIGLTRSRSELYQRIDQRIERMIAEGLISEVRALLSEGYSPDLPTMSAIGYAEIVSFLSGKIGLDEAIRLMKRRTRQFVRRQAAWFRSDDLKIAWINANDASAVERMVTALESGSGWINAA